ncbi:hypothetical protein IRJ41_008834 [Triplophysa rosa]|uniref:Uncharacterized protein n=1 Tax=Triplophysa rosa TaxID=992332 RepID=A0A9W8C325_TRIRA|nr:hypothetical protein IRJ41_008834 [Triplophysa rosa]
MRAHTQRDKPSRHSFDNSCFLIRLRCREPAHWQLGKGRKSFQDGVFLCVKSNGV